jgi:hypothetical protein
MELRPSLATQWPGRKHGPLLTEGISMADSGSGEQTTHQWVSVFQRMHGLARRRVKLKTLHPCTFARRHAAGGS